MTEVPALTPVTKPLAALTVATAGVALLHTPPAVVLVHVSVLPIHNGETPVIVWAIGAVIVTVPVVVIIPHPPVSVTV